MGRLYKSACHAVYLGCVHPRYLHLSRLLPTRQGIQADHLKMKGTISTVLLALLSGSPASAGPVQRRQETVTQTVTASAPSAPTPWTWNAGGSQTWPIHESCNATERALLNKGLDDAATLAAHAKDHVLRFGNSSAMFQKYFGTAPSAEVVGWYDKIANGDRSRFKFRCDDADGNCVLPGMSSYIQIPSPVFPKFKVRITNTG